MLMIHIMKLTLSVILLSTLIPMFRGKRCDDVIEQRTNWNELCSHLRATPIESQGFRDLCEVNDLLGRLLGGCVSSTCSSADTKDSVLSSLQCLVGPYRRAGELPRH